LNKAEKLPSVWPKTTKQQVFRNYQRMDNMTSGVSSKNNLINTKRNRQQSFNQAGYGKNSK